MLDRPWESFSWLKSDTFTIFISMQCFSNKGADESLSLADIPDDPNLASAFDYHNLITSELGFDLSEPIPTADEVIEELDEIMGYNEMTSGIMSTLSNSLLETSNDSGFIQSIIESGVDLHTVSLTDLQTVCELADAHVERLSQELVDELSCREELLYRQEQMEHFVTQLHALQQRIDAFIKAPTLVNGSTGHQETTTTSIPSKLSALFSSLKKSPIHVEHPCERPAERSHLTLSIPYHSADVHGGCISTNLLRALNHLLSSMLSNNADIHLHLTRYLLDVYTPAAVKHATPSSHP